MGDALLAAEQRQHLGIGVEFDAEPALVERGHRLAETGSAAIRGVLMGVGQRHLPLGLDDDGVGRGQVGITDAE